MNLPEHLKKKRDEVGELFDRSSWYGRRSMDYFDAGFDASCAELLPMIEKLEKALDRTIFDMNQSMLLDKAPISLMLKDAHDAIVELKKWREL